MEVGGIMSELKIGDKVLQEGFMKLDADPQNFISTMQNKAFDTLYRPDVKAIENTEFKQAQQAQIRTAENTEKMITQQETIISNQNEYIKTIREQHVHTMQVLENIFASSEDNVGVQKEIMRIMQENDINEGLIKDKGMDMFIQGLFMCISIYLSSKGVKF